MNRPHKIAIIGLGYVGLPLARLFATQYAVVGYDINQKRIDELRQGKDTTLEISEESLGNVLVQENLFSVTEGTEHSKIKPNIYSTNFTKGSFLFATANILNTILFATAFKAVSLCFPFSSFCS